MNNDYTTPTETVETEVVNDSTTEAVRDAEAVLRKNRELLEQNARLKRQLAGAEDIDLEKAKAALAQMQKLEEEQMQKRGEYEKLIEQKSKAYEDRLESERQARANMERMLKQEKLALALIENGVLPDRVNYLVKDLSEQVDLELGDAGFALKRRGGIGDAAEFNQLIEDLRDKSPFFFAANIVSGTGGSGSSNSSGVSTRKWSDLNGAEKAVAIRDSNGDIELAKKKFK
jgi:hypothetical protein